MDPLTLYWHHWKLLRVQEASALRCFAFFTYNDNCFDREKRGPSSGGLCLWQGSPLRRDFVKLREKVKNPAERLAHLGLTNHYALPSTEGGFLEAGMFSAQTGKLGWVGHFSNTRWPLWVGVAIMSVRGEVAVILTSTIIWFHDLQLH